MASINNDKEIKDFRYAKGLSISSFVEQLSHVGFQSLHIGKAAEIIRKMKEAKATIILTFTSNMVSSGLRGLFAQLLEKKFVDAVITTAGAIEEDLMKAKGLKFLEGSFDVDDIALGKKGINRIGNIFVPNDTYGGFEDIAGPIFNQLY
ncbi:deoxyhypusine synthase family protein, partial [Candidatus Woesearchaeota archaeon]|nr:deoxyhypusine synthase family protein [Candidatus Woesearchaeota archaeon]